MDPHNDNITYRKTYKSSSFTDLSSTINSSDKSIIDTTMMSIPDSLNDNTDLINDLNEQIKTLKMQLSSAHQEIENLNIENFRLKSDLQNMIKTTNTLKIICSTPNRKNMSPAQKIKTLNLDTNQSCETIEETLSKSQTNRVVNNPIMLHKETQTTILDKLSPQTNPPTEMNKTPSVDNISNCHINHRATNEIIELTSTTNSNIMNRTEGATCPNYTTLTTQMKTTKQTPKRKLCILSNSNLKGRLHDIEDIFAANFKYCSYHLPNCTLERLLYNINNKLHNYTLNDYCIILIGERDFKQTDTFIELVQHIRECLQPITHTNIILSVPTYKLGAPIYNYKIEMFSNLLHLDILNNKYAYIFDTNYELTYDMFSSKTGSITNYAMKQIFKNIMKEISVDLNIYPYQDMHTPQNKNTLSNAVNQENCQSNFFRI